MKSPPSRRKPRLAVQTVGLGLRPGQVALVRALPIAAGLAWLATLSVLLLVWAFVDDHRRYKSDTASVPYLSHVGGAHPSIFLTGCILTSFTWYASYAIERLLRYEHFLLAPPRSASHSRKWNLVGWLDLFLNAIGAGSLILVATFNAFTEDEVHTIFTAIFAGALCLSGFIQVAELRVLFRHHTTFKALHRNAWLKLVLLILASLLLVGYETMNAVCEDARTSATCWNVQVAAATSEWVACYLSGIYLLSLSWDLWPVERYVPPS